MRKMFFVRIVLTAIIAFGLAISPVYAADYEDIIYVSIMAIDEAQEQLIKELIPKYISENSIESVEFDVTRVTQESREAYIAELDTALNKKTSTTIFPIYDRKDLDRLGDRLASLDDSVAAMYAVASTVKPMMQDGKVYGLPMSLEATSILCNKLILEAAEIDAFDIYDYDSLEETVFALSEMKNELGIDAVFGLDEDDVLKLGQTLGGIFFSAEFEEDYKAAKEAKEFRFMYSGDFRAYSDLIVDYSNYTNDAKSDGIELNNAFAEGKAAMTIGNADYYDMLVEANPELADAVGIIPFETDICNGILVKSPVYWAVSGHASDDEVYEALSFLDWLYNSEAGVKEYYPKFDNITPPYTALGTVDFLDPLAAAFFEYADYDDTIVLMDDIYPEGYSEKIFGVNFVEYVNNKLTFDDFTKLASEEYR